MKALSRGEINTRGFSFRYRFIALTFVGYLTAVGAAAFAVSVGSGPVLSAWHKQTIHENAEANAQAVRILLREIGLKTLSLATDPDVVKITVGDEANVDRARDRLQGFVGLDDLLEIYVFDFEGQVVLHHGVEDTAKARFDRIASAHVAREVLTNPEEEFRFSFRSGYDLTDTFIVAQPIRHRGFVEGVLVAEFAVDTSTLMAQIATIGTVTLATPFQHRVLREVTHDLVSVPVEGGDFFVVLHPDNGVVATAGKELVDRVLLAVGFFLIMPFCVMSIAGLRSIVAPHRALMESQFALRANQKKLSELADIAQRANDAIVTTDLDGLTTWVNPAFTQITGFTSEEVLGRKPGDVLQGPDTDPVVRQRIAEALAAREPIRTEILNYLKDGTPYWNAINIAPQLDENGQPYGFVAIATDVTETREAQDSILRAKAQIEYQANHDPLTGLPNRRALDDALERLKDDDDSRVLVRIDLDHFKNVNDTLGHAAGDHVLTVVSDLIVSHVRKGDLAARVGGDEFVILMDRATEVEHALALAERLLRKIQKEIVFEDKTCRIGASFGVAATGDGMLSNRELLLGADSALYLAKEQGRSCVVSYTEDLHNSVVKNRNIAKEIEVGILNREFEPFFHPQFDAKTFEFCGLEVLARWLHPTRGVLAPNEFLSIAEHLSVSGDLDALILERGLQAVHELNQSGFHVPKVSFNVVASRLEQPKLPEIVHQLSFQETQVCFEVLESVLVEEQSDLFQNRVDLLREIGFGIEVDDFGSGHASIIGLTKLAPDCMKVDQRLIFPIVDSLSARKMIRAIVEIARALDIKLTAEGVETAAHAKLLSEFGYDTLQGFYFAKPMSAPDLKRFLTNYNAAEVRAVCLQQSTEKQRA